MNEQPRLQQTPVRTEEARKIALAFTGTPILDLDFEKLELRLLADWLDGIRVTND